MTLKQVIESDLVKDTDRITIKRSIAGVCRKVVHGEWYTDRVLDLMDEEVYSLSWVTGYGWTFNLDREVVQ